MSNISYQITRHTAAISVSEYIDGFVDVETFLEACRACHNYDKRWSCPSYDFHVLDFWKKYKTLNLLASKITFSEKALNRTYTREEINHILDEVLIKEKERLSLELFKEEENTPEASAFPPEAAQDVPSAPEKRESPVFSRIKCAIPLNLSEEMWVLL